MNENSCPILSKVGPIYLPLEHAGKTPVFELNYYHTPDGRWAAARLGDPQSAQSWPLRIESACFFGHVFGSQQCDCGYQLREAFRRIAEIGQGIVIYAIDQDARGLGIEAHFSIYRMRQAENLDTQKIFERFGKPLDSRTYLPVALILRDLAIKKITLMSNNHEREKFLVQNGFEVERQELEAPMTRFNMATMMLEKEDLAYAWNFKTHADWLEPLQEQVLNDLNKTAVAVVRDNHSIDFEFVADDWNVAANVGEWAASTMPNLSNSVLYLTSLPRRDELGIYSALGLSLIVVPFELIPDWLKTSANRHGIKIQDWGRRNKFKADRPQWALVESTSVRDVYERNGERRLVNLGSTNNRSTLEQH